MEIEVNFRSIYPISKTDRLGIQYTIKGMYWIWMLKLQTFTCPEEEWVWNRWRMNVIGICDIVYFKAHFVFRVALWIPWWRAHYQYHGVWRCPRYFNTYSGREESSQSDVGGVDTPQSSLSQLFLWRTNVQTRRVRLDTQRETKYVPAPVCVSQCEML